MTLNAGKIDCLVLLRCIVIPKCVYLELKLLFVYPSKCLTRQRGINENEIIVNIHLNKLIVAIELD